MKHHLPALDGLKVFEAAARHLSFSLAADELCITKGAVSYQIRKLENHLQCALFKRTVRQVYLTDGGQMLLQTTQNLFRELGETFERVSEVKQQNSVTVAATTYVAARWLSSRISAFNDEFPNITVLLQHSVNSADFKLSDVDMAIRWGPCKDTQENNHFGQIPMALYPVLSPKTLKRQKLSPTIALSAKQLESDAFAKIPLLCEDRKQDLWQEWKEANVKDTTVGPGKLLNPRRIISDANVRVQAAIDGQGLILADELMASELNNNLLVSPFSEKLHGYGYVFMFSANSIQNQSAQTLKDWLSINAVG